MTKYFAWLICGLMLGIVGSSLSQTAPGFTYGYVPTAGQWNSYFAGKVDYNAYGVPVGTGGTGNTTFPTGQVLLGNGTSPLTTQSPSTMTVGYANNLAGGTVSTSLTITGAASYVVATTDYRIIQTTTAGVYYLPIPASGVGRELALTTEIASAVTSSSLNVIPMAGGAAASAILANTAGKWAKIQSDGTYWRIVEGN
jgi:hypothetical protein